MCVTTRRTLRSDIVGGVICLIIQLVSREKIYEAFAKCHASLNDMLSDFYTM